MSKITEIYRDTIKINSTISINIANKKTKEKINSQNQINSNSDNKINTIKDKLDIKKENSNSNIESNELTEAEKKLVNQYKNIDRKVRAHEAAHRLAGGGLVRGATNFKYEVGPDGKRYAVAGEVKIDLSYDLDDPKETIRKMQQVRRAALAPSDPSPQDRAVAAKASLIEAKARRELQKLKLEENNNQGLIQKKYQDINISNDNLIGSIFNSIY